MKKEKMKEKCLECSSHKPSKEYPLVLNKQARWVTGVHCSNYEIRPAVIPSTRGMKCKYLNIAYMGVKK